MSEQNKDENNVAPSDEQIQDALNRLSEVEEGFGFAPDTVPATKPAEPEQPASVPVAKVSGMVTLEAPTSTAAKDIPGKPIFTLRMTVDEFQSYVTQYPNFKATNDQASRQWLDALRDAYGLLLNGNPLSGALKRPDANWRQNVEYEGIKLQAGIPLLSDPSGQKLTGDRAILKIRKEMGLGTLVQFPMWHSGFWVTLETPTDAELLNLERKLAEAKIDLGRMTNGLIFSNSMVYTINAVFDFIVDHIYDTTIDESTPDKIRSLLKVTDLPILAWAMAAVIYPNGFTHSQPCTINPAVCRHVTKEHLILSKLHITDNSAFTTKQRKFMANRVAKHTEAEILDYQTQGRGADGKLLEIKNGVKFALRIPTVQQYVENGFAWVQEIVDMVDNVIGDQSQGKTYNEFITKHSDLVALRQYGHWVKHVVTRDNEVIDDIGNVSELMNLLSGDNDIVSTFLEGIKGYIDEATCSMVAIPAFPCPACTKPMTPEDSKHPYMIPLETVTLFFTLKDRKLMRARTN